MQLYRLGVSWLGSSFAEKDLGSWWTPSKLDSAVHPSQLHTEQWRKYPERVGNLQHWRYSTLDWTRPWTTCFDFKDNSVLGRRLSQVESRGFSQSKLLYFASLTHWINHLGPGFCEDNLENEQCLYIDISQIDQSNVWDCGTEPMSEGQLSICICPT